MEAAQDDFVVAFKVPRDKSRTLGLRLAQLPGGRGAVFDGWRDDKDSTGENHELLEVGDRLLAVDEVLVAPGTSSFERIGRLVREAIESLLRKDEELEAEENETRRYGLAPVRSKYTSTPNQRTSLRIQLRFRKPSHEQSVLLDTDDFDMSSEDEATAPTGAALGAWFCPPNDSMNGAAFEGLVADAAPGVQRAFKDVRPGLRLIAVNNRAVEGLKFDVVLDCVREAVFPLVLRLGGAPVVSDPEETRAIARGLDPHFRILQKPFGAAHLAGFFASLAEADREQVVNRIQDGLRLDVRDSGGRTPLMCACMLAREDDAAYFVELFLHEGAEVAEVDSNNAASALHFAARIGHDRVTRLLLTAGANPNLADRQGRTPVLEAIICNNIGTVETLLHAGGDAGLVERSAGWNGLHYAALNGRENIVELLMRRGKLSPHTRTLPGPWRAPRTALDIAREAEHVDAACLLHESLMREPLQRVYPRGGDWVIADETLAVVDLPWRQGDNFRSLHAVETKRRNRACNKLDFFRSNRPIGRQDPRELLRQENAISAFDDGEGGAEFWLGSREALLKNTYRENKSIDAVILILDSGIDRYRNANNKDCAGDRDCDGARPPRSKEENHQKRSEGSDEQHVLHDHGERHSLGNKESKETHGEERQGIQRERDAQAERETGPEGEDMAESDSIDACEEKGLDVDDARLKWVGELEDHYIIQRGISTFEDLTSSHLSRLIRFIEGAEQKKRRLLIAAADANASEALLMPSVILMAYFMISKNMRLAEAREILRQRCYFYTAGAAHEKALRLREMTNCVELQAESEAAALIAHETRPEMPRVFLPEPWLQGLQTLEDHILARRIKAARRRQADFRTKFIM
ncbi:Ankyrin repeat domain-containing protein 50 [Hondaea fermentalgiana]|uniref:Ankyrin repeat domain-containing protein 50 n=1 Tax=Hondaea fermentalgiana TaxID=2315210 RepID=A0A2R5GR82_9STRA|nr:Ankyrin repeat domain-containing protein 50 [Hondaea fermentalgiana]|eukprot:GBG33105.1 Ankyrin repeat domain-containing protein 50 [Hondaea fermentalgiana]